MSKHIFILAIPGSGTKKEGFTKKLQKDLKRYTHNTPLANNYTLNECLPYNHTGIDSDQEALFERMKENNKLGGILSLRKAFLGAFGDAVVFENDATNPNSAYFRLHQYLKDCFETAYDQMQNYDESKLVILAGSMAIHVLNCYIWDADNGIRIFENTPATNRNNLKNLSYLATIGCNIPIYLSAKQPNAILPIAKRNATFSWDNYYDKDDVLGWPLQPLCPAYNNLVTDYQINTGLYVGSHMKYWDDNSLTKPFAEKLVALFGE